MKGKLLNAVPDKFQALNSDKSGWVLTIETRFLKRKVTIRRFIDYRTRVSAFIGKNIDV
jgi:hypothetical protein